MSRPDRFSRNPGRLSFLSAHGLRWTRVTPKPVRSGDEVELDFVVNYDVKYRMGASAGEEEE